jgi:uncharacterized damage-inducible protein DinB
MTLNQTLFEELQQEANLTRKILERVPADQLSWKPHEKSMSLGRLATHLTETIQWVTNIESADSYDFLANPFKGHVAADTTELLALFEERLAKALSSLSTITDEGLEQEWSVRRGEHVLANTLRRKAIRSWALSHHIHHRGQLSVYLRLLDIPVPGMYGPSADER